MVAMTMFCGTRIRCTHLLFQVGDDLTGGVEGGGNSSGRRFHGVVDLVQSTCGIGLQLQASDQFKGSMATTSALGQWSLGARADMHKDFPILINNVRPAPVRERQLRRAGSSLWWLSWSLLSRRSKNLGVVFIIFWMLCTSFEFME
jgi:hypothetical protein